MLHKKPRPGVVTADAEQKPYTIFFFSLFPTLWLRKSFVATQTAQICLEV
jgi:hypothetical protein